MIVSCAEEFHDIAPAVEYSLIPPWVIFIGAFVGLTLAGLLGWWLAQKRKRAQPPKLPRQRAIEALERAGEEIERMTPYQFSICVSDILRRYVTEQYALPLTRQTSVEFLIALRNSVAFSEDAKSLLADFLDRCDLIKFARYDATPADSQLLLEEAFRFVRGGELATV